MFDLDACHENFLVLLSTIVWWRLQVRRWQVFQGLAGCPPTAATSGPAVATPATTGTAGPLASSALPKVSVLRDPRRAARVSHQRSSMVAAVSANNPAISTTKTAAAKCAWPAA